MKTTNQNEASAPANVRPSESKNGKQTAAMVLREDTPTLPGFQQLVKPFKFASQPYEYKVTPLRECPTPENLQICDTPDQAAAYWRLHTISAKPRHSAGALKFSAGPHAGPDRYRFPHEFKEPCQTESKYGVRQGCQEKKCVQNGRWRSFRPSADTVLPDQPQEGLRENTGCGRGAWPNL
jgi:hypothetical protein